MKPYFEEDGIVIYCGDCRDFLSDIPKSDLLLTDPPYGIGADRNLRANTQHGRAAAPSKDYGRGSWDSEPVDTSLLSRCRWAAKHNIIFGGNFFSLPAVPCWLVWDKDNGNNGYADCELAWTNLPGAVRRLRYRWMGMLQENMAMKEYRDHPTQKPVPVMRWAATLSPEYGTILDPFMGSGSTLRAAKDLGSRAIGIEIDERYCEIAAKRLGQQALDFNKTGV